MVQKDYAKKYINVASLIEHQIGEGIWMAGDRLPSVRQMSRDLKISPGTVQHAYAELEDRGIIAARVRSGFYVSPDRDMEIPPPVEKPFSAIPGEVNILETSIEIMENNGGRATYRLGSALPLLENEAAVQIRACLKRAAHAEPNHYEGPLGYPPLRKEIARRSIRSGRAIQEDRLLITTGCQESLVLALQSVTDAGDLVLVESPCYYGVLQTLEVLGRRVLEIRLCPEQGMDLNLLEDLMKRHPVKAMVINSSFSNPTGYCYSRQEKEHICCLFQRYEIPLIEDDIFAELSFSESRPPSIHSFDDQGIVLLCSSFSKTLSQDLRIGWLEAGRFFKKARAIKYVSSLGTPALYQYALADFLSTQKYERHLRHVRREYRNRQQWFLQYIKQVFPEDTQVSQPRGGYLAWMKLDRSADSMEIYRKALAVGVGITPGAIFSPSGRFNHYLRLNWGNMERGMMEESLRLLGRIVSH